MNLDRPGWDYPETRIICYLPDESDFLEPGKEVPLDPQNSYTVNLRCAVALIARQR